MLTRRRTTWIRSRAARVVVDVVPIGAPFPHVPRDVVEAEGIRREGIDGRRARVAVVASVLAWKMPLEHVHAVLAKGLELAAPRERSVGACPRGILPLRFRWEARPRPRAIRAGVVPRDVDQGMVPAVLQGRLWSFGMPPVRTFDLTPPLGTDHAAR